MVNGFYRLSVSNSIATERILTLAYTSGKLLDASTELEKLARATVFPDLPEKERSSGTDGAVDGNATIRGSHVVAHLNRTLHLEGDVCEFGVAQGATSALIAMRFVKQTRSFGSLIASKACPGQQSRTYSSTIFSILAQSKSIKGSWRLDRIR